MRFTEDESHRDLRSSVRSFLDEHAPMDHVRRVAETGGHDAGLWRRLCQELQVAAICIPEEYGGLGAPFSYQAIVLEELGRALTPTPYLSSAVLAATAVRLAGDERRCAELLPPIATGELVATVAAMESPHDWDLVRIATRATAADGGLRVSGTKRWVTDGADAGLAVVLAETQEGPTLMTVDLASPGVTCRALPTLDPTRGLAEIHLDGAPARPLGRPGEGRQTLDQVFRIAGIALAAEQLGGAQRCLEMAVHHARERVQFGRPIGSFQALKHLLADQLVENEALTAAVRHAAVAVDALPDEVELASHLCQSVASETFLEAAGHNIQVHGGIGYTWEHDAHLYFKRATASRQWLGTPEHHREKVAALMLDRATRPEEEHAWNR